MNTQAATDSGFHENKSFVAVDSNVPSAGAVIWWRLRGPVDYDVMRAAWLAAGLNENELPSPCSPSVALRRAVEELREKRLLVRPLGRSNGFAIVREMLADANDTLERLGSKKANRELEYEVQVKITLDVAGRVEIESVNADAERTERYASEVRAAFDRNINALDTTDFSQWLLRMLPKLDAVGLRDGGGFYFVPHTAVERIGIVAKVLRSVSGHVLSRMPAMRTEEAVEAILDAINEEADFEANRLEKDIEEMKLGEQGFNNRVIHCDEVEAKVARYEVLLGTKLDTVRERLEALRARLTLAVLKTQQTEAMEGL